MKRKPKNGKLTPGLVLIDTWHLGTSITLVKKESRNRWQVRLAPTGFLTSMTTLEIHRDFDRPLPLEAQS